MSEDRKMTPHDDALRDCATDLRRFMRALAGPTAITAADQVAQAALARIADERCEAPRERAFAEAVRLNRQRLRDAHLALAESPPDHPVDSGRREAGLAIQVAQMPLEEREVLLIVSLGRFGYESASQILEIPRSSVVSRLMRARARLDGVKGAVTRASHLRLVK